MKLNPLFSESIIREMARGDISPTGSGILDTPMVCQLRQEREQTGAALWMTLTPDQRSLWEQYQDRLCDHQATAELEIFVYAFKLGVKMATEILEKEDI